MKRQRKGRKNEKGKNKNSTLYTVFIYAVGAFPKHKTAFPKGKIFNINKTLINLQDLFERLPELLAVNNNKIKILALITLVT